MSWMGIKKNRCPVFQATVKLLTKSQSVEKITLTGLFLVFSQPL